MLAVGFWGLGWVCLVAWCLVGFWVADSLQIRTYSLLRPLRDSIVLFATIFPLLIRLAQGRTSFLHLGRGPDYLRGLVGLGLVGLVFGFGFFGLQAQTPLTWCF